MLLIILILAGAIAQFAVVWHLWRKSLLPRFPFLALHLAALGLWSSVSAFLPPAAPINFVVWKTGALVTTFTLIAAFVETVVRSLEHYPGISMRVVLGACGTIAALSAILGALEPVYPLYEEVRVLLLGQRISGLAVAVAAVALVIVLNFLDPRRRPNVIRHERIMAAMAATTALAAWFNNHFHLVIGGVLLHAGNLVFTTLWI